MAKTEKSKSYGRSKEPAQTKDKTPEERSRNRVKLDAVLEESGLGPKQGVYIGSQIKDSFDKRIPFNIFGLNVITRGGAVFNAVTEIVGPPSTFKTTMALGLVAQAQLKYGKNCNVVWLSTENGIDPNWARHQGVKIPYSEAEVESMKAIGIEGEALQAKVDEQASGGRIIVLASDKIEDDMDRAKVLLNTGEIDIFVLDSAGAVSASAEREAESIGDKQVTENVRLISKFVRYLHSVGNKLSMENAETAIVIINQVRAKIGGMPTYAPVYEKPGGWQLKHGKAISLETKVAGSLRDGDMVWGKQVAVKVGKSKVCIEGRTCTISYVVRGDNPLRIPVGPDTALETLQLAQDANLIRYEGRTWKFGADTIEYEGKPAGKEDLVFALRSNPVLLKRVQDDVTAYHNSIEIK